MRIRTAGLPLARADEQFFIGGALTRGRLNPAVADWVDLVRAEERLVR
jgi:hypothetical protein